MNDKLIEIQFPQNILVIIDEWASLAENGVGVCLLCGSVIHVAAESIPSTSTHNCAAGRLLDQAEPHA